MEPAIIQQVRSIMEPRSIAVIGAGEDRRKWNGRMIFNPLRTGYKGAIYPVNPNRDTVFGIKAYRSILDVPEQVDLAVIVVPVKFTPEIMKECVKRGVGGAVIITAGFAEAGEAGKSIQDEVVKIAHQGGIRFVGPNCAGIYSSTVGLNLATSSAKPGHIAFVSQSGTLGSYLFQYADSKGYGLSKFISAGNQASLYMSDYLEYLAQDADTKAIVLYVEGVKEGRRFLDVAREVVKKKPIVVFKGGKSGPGTRAAMSHTGSLSGSDAIFDAVCKQAGIIRCSECFHPFELAEALATQPVPRGKRITIIGSGGQSVTTADACVAQGMELPEFDEDTRRRLMKMLPEFASVQTNPLDSPGGGAVHQFVDILLSLDYIDGIIVRGMTERGSGRELTAGETAEITENAEGIVAAFRKHGKPIVISSMPTHRTSIGADILKKAGIPIYATPEDAARAMSGLVKYGEILRSIS